MFKYRLYPSRVQQGRLVSACIALKGAYNKLLEDSVAEYESTGKGKVSQFYFNTRLKKVPVDATYVFSQSLQNVSKRLSDAYKAFFRRIKAGEKPGFPRFKSRVHSITYPQAGFKFTSDAKLQVSKIGRIPIVKHRELVGSVKTLTLKQNKIGQWFAVFSCEVETKKVKHKGKKIGIDVGLTHFATLSNGEKIENPRHLLKSEERLKLLHRRVSRKVKGSMNRRKAKYRLAKLELKVANQRSDFLHKLSYTLTQKYKTITLEDLNISNMVKNHCLAKHIHDAGWGMFARMCSYKAVTCGGTAEQVVPNGTSQTCNKCGTHVKMTLKDRVFTCPSCGEVCDRDENAARNILARGTVGLTGTTPVERRPLPSDSVPLASLLAEAGTIRGVLCSTN